MNLTHALLGEHGVFASLFDHLEQLARSGATVATLQTALAAPARALVEHARMEENLLFPAIEQAMGSIPPLHVMKLEHSEIERQLEVLERHTDPAVLAREILGMLEFTKAHFAKEEHVLFPMAEQCVGSSKLGTLTSQWSKQRAVHCE